MSKENQLTPEEITSVISEQPDLYEPTVQPLDAIQQNGYYPIELDEDNNQAITPSLAKLATPKSDRNWMERLKVSAKNAVSNIMNEQLTHNVAMGNALVTIGDKEQVEYGRRMASEAKRHLDEIMDDTEQLTPEEAESWAAAIGSGSVSMVDFAANLALLRGLGAGKVGAEIGAGILAGIAGYEEGATSDVEKYIADTGDTELKNYKGDKKALAVNAASGAVQGGIEALTSGLGRYILNNPLSKKVLGTAGQNAIRKVMGSAVGRALAAGANESVNNAFEEWTQQLTGNLAEIVKGNKEFTVDNILQGAGQAAGVGALLGWMATPVMQEYGRRKTRDWVSDKLRKAADEKGIEISDAEIKKAADDLVGAIESKGVQQVTDNYEKINQITGAESDLAKTLSKAFEDLVNAGRVRFRGATEDEVRQAGLDWANWMQAQAILDSLDRGVALSEHPLNNAVAELDRIYLEGTNAGEGDLLTLDINNAQVQYLAEQIDDFIQKSQQSREQAEAARIEALREAELNARLEAVKELEQNAIAELEKARLEQNEEAIANLTLDLNMLTARVDSLTSELQGLITNRQQNTGRISIKQAKGLESPRKAPKKLPTRQEVADRFNKEIVQADTFTTDEGTFTNYKIVGDDRNMPAFTVFESPDGFIVRNAYVPESMQKGGIATNFYMEMNERSLEQTGNPLRSTQPRTLNSGKQVFELSEAGKKLWDSMVSKGLASKLSDGTYEFNRRVKEKGLLFQDLPAELKEQFRLAEENARMDEMYPEYTGDTIVVDGKERTVYNSEGKRINKSAEALTNFWRWFGDSKAVDSKGRPLVLYHGARGNKDIKSFDPSKGFNVEASYFATNRNAAGHWALNPYLKSFDSVEDVMKRANNTTDVNGLLDLYNKYDYENARITETDGEYWLESDYGFSYLGKKTGDYTYTNNSGKETNILDVLRRKIAYSVGKAVDSDLYSVYARVENPLLVPAGKQPYWKIDFMGKTTNTETIAQFAKDHGFDGVIITDVYETDYENKLTDDVLVFNSKQVKSTDNFGYYGLDNDRLDYQIGYASMKGEMIGDYIDANKFAHTGEGPNVHGWGNYFLASKEKDKENYLKKFESQGPDLRYDGKEFNSFMLSGLGITYPETQSLIMNRLGDLSITKAWLTKTLRTYLRNSENLYENKVDNVVKQFTMLGEHTEEEIRAIIKDIEDITKLTGYHYGATFGFPKGSEEAKIQEKHLKNEESRKLFKEVYDALFEEFGGEDNLSTNKGFFEGTIRSLMSQRESLEAVKKLDFDKITGRTGLLYKGIQLKDYIEKYLDAPYMWRVKQDFYYAMRNAMALGKDPIKAIESLDFAQKLFDEEKLKADIEKRIAEKVDPKDKVLTSKIKGAFDAFLNSLDTGASMDSIMSGLGLSENEKEIINDITTDMEGHDYLFDENNSWNPSIAEVFFSLREDKAMNETLKKAKELFKDAKKEDFEYKAAASMWKTNKIPENNELLDEQKPLYKQPEQVKEAIKKLYADTGMGIRPVVTYNVHIKDVLKDGDILKKINTDGTYFANWEIVEEYNRFTNHFIEVWVSRGLSDAKTYIKENIEARQAEMDGAKRQAKKFDGSDENSADRANKEMWEGRVARARVHRDIVKQVWDKIKNIPDNANVDDYATTSETFSDESGKKYLQSLVDDFGLEHGDYLKPEDVGAKSSVDAAVKLMLKYGIRGIRYFGREDGRGFVTFEPTLMTERIYQDNVDKLVATHGIRKEGIEQALEVGGFAMPSLAITKDLDSNTYGEILFVAPASMAQPSRTTRVYDRDAWTPMVDFVEYTAREGFFDRVKEILVLHGVDPNATSTYVSNIEQESGTWPENNIMAKQLFGIYKGMDVNEVPYIQREFDNNSDLRKEYLNWYKEFIVPNMKGRIFKGFSKNGNRIYAPATLENIMKEIKTQPEHRVFPDMDAVNFHDVARELVSRFKSTKEIKKEQDRLVDTNTAYEGERELQVEYYDLAASLNTVEGSQYPEFRFSAALLDTDGTLAERLKKYDFKNDEESVKKVEAIIEKIKKMPARYFEAKPKRAVRFNEFKAVFVPALQEYDEIAFRLGEQGARVIRYDSSAQRDDLFNQLVSEEKDIQFQNKKTSASKTGLGKEYRGAYDPLTRAILFSKVSDVTTLFHESAHYWFDRNLRYYKTGMASPEWKDRWEKVMEELGVVPNARGYVTAASVKAGSEKFARSMEAYLKTGEYENAAMQWAHQDYKNMVGRVYRNLWKNYWGLEDLSPAVKDWFNMNGFDVSNPMTAFAEKTTMDTAEEDIGNIVATDETKPDVPAVVQEEADAANGQVVENRKGEVAIVPEDEYETNKRAHSKLPESAERATGVEMEPIMFNRRSMSDSLRAARDLVDRDPVRAWEALKAGDDMIDGLYAGDIYRALISKYKEENNPTMIKTVVQSFANAARRAGRSVKAFDLETPTVSFEGTISSLNKVFATKSNDAKVNELVKQIKNFLHDPEALNKGWEEFKKAVECK